MKSLLQSAILFWTATLAGTLSAQQRNHFMLGGHAGFNLRAEFGNSMPNLSASNPGSTAGIPPDRFYDDGYVRLDSSGNAGGFTWYWGYENAAQDLSGSISFHSRAIEPGLPKLPSQTEATGGLEFVYQRDLQVGDHFRWGAQAAFSYTPASFSSQTSAPGAVTTTTDTYSYMPAILPQAPYHGTFAGPGALIMADPVIRSTTSEPATIVSERELEADIFGLRLGPYVAWTIIPDLEVGLGGGLSLAPTTSRLRYHDTATGTAGSTLVDLAGTKESTEFLAGGYFEVFAGYSFATAWSVQAGVQYQYLSDLKLEMDGREGVLHPGDAVFVSLGVGYSF